MGQITKDLTHWVEKLRRISGCVAGAPTGCDPGESLASPSLRWRHCATGDSALSDSGEGIRPSLDAHPQRMQAPVLVRLFLWHLEQILGWSGNVGGSGQGKGVGCERMR